MPPFCLVEVVHSNKKNHSLVDRRGVSEMTREIILKVVMLSTLILVDNKDA